MPAQIAVTHGESMAESAVTGQVLRSSRQFLPHHSLKSLARALLIPPSPVLYLASFGVNALQVGGKCQFEPFIWNSACWTQLLCRSPSPP
jgi:hypothetical protein